MPRMVCDCGKTFETQQRVRFCRDMDHDGKPQPDVRIEQLKVNAAIALVLLLQGRLEEAREKLSVYQPYLKPDLGQGGVGWTLDL